MAEKTQEKHRVLGNFRLKPIHRGTFVGGTLVIGQIKRGNLHIPKYDSAIFGKTPNIVAAVGGQIEHLDRECVGNIVTVLKGGGNYRLIRIRHISSPSYFLPHVERLSEEDSALLKKAKEIQEQEKRAARKERMHRVVGMWSHFTQDSVEMQNELRDDWS